MRAIWIFALLAACHDTAGTGFEERAQRRKAWESLGITDYSFTRSRSANFGDPPLRVTVRGGVITRALFEDGAVLGDPSALRTVDGTFDLIDTELDHGVDELRVTYDPARSFPTLVVVDPSRNVADDEFGLTLTDLTPE